MVSYDYDRVDSVNSEDKDKYMFLKIDPNRVSESEDTKYDFNSDLLASRPCVGSMDHKKTTIFMFSDFVDANLVHLQKAAEC